MVENEIEQVVSFHKSAERITDWNLSEINQVISTIFSAGEVVGALDGFTKENNHKLDKAQARTAIIERLSVLARHSYGKIEAKAREKGIDWAEIEKAVLIRSIDTLWIEHLEAMASMRQGIGLRGYGQRDPLIEYKREAYGLYNELNNLIAKEVVYSIFKIGALQIEEREFTAPSLLERARRFTAPAKTMDAGTASFAGYKTAGSASSSGAPAAPQAGSGDLIKQKTKDAEGNKVGRNDPCPCGSGKKYKKCHGV